MIQVNNLTHKVDSDLILNNFSYKFNNGQLTGILAPVEENMPELLRMMCGITEPQQGNIYIEKIDIFNDSPERIKNIRKKISFVFNRGGLISNLSILENLLLPLDFHFPDEDHTMKLDKIKAIFEHFGLNINLLSERPATLHPQFKKLMLIIRAFLPNPAIILYDNPLVDLELSFKKKIIGYLYKLQSNGVTQIFVSTSDVLLELSDVNLVFKSGCLIESGKWEDLIMSNSIITKNIIREYLEVGINET